MWSFLESNQSDTQKTILTYTLGAVSGLTIGLLLSRRGARRLAHQYGGEMRDRLDGATSRSARGGIADAVDDPELTGLEDAVLDAFLGHEVLSERGIDVGAISRGIVELSGSVYTEDEADLAVRVANAVSGVHTVVNRLEVEEEADHLEETRRRLEDGDPALVERHWEGRRVGMGRMRQGAQTEPDRPDDSQHRIERALKQADRDQWIEEFAAHENSRVGARPEDERPDQKPEFDHDELDNQDPHGRHHASNTLDEQPQELRSSSRVGEGLKPGTELRLEDADIPLKPHSDIDPAEGGRDRPVL
jgi:hypothetical protein